MTASLAASRIQAAMNGVELHQAGVLLTVDGTMYPWAPADFPPPGSGFSSDMAYALMDAADGLWAWEGVGYPAAVTPMKPSWLLARAGLVQRIMGHPLGTKTVMSGYSQGAMAVGYCWVHDILDPAGPLHDRYLNGDFVRVYNYGDPFRCPGIANGNLLAGIPLPKKLDGATTGGIAGSGCLTAAQTPAEFLSFALDGDIYACAPVGEDPWKAEAAAGKVGTSIFNVIQQATFLDIIAVAGDLFAPIGLVEEVINGMKFAAAGTNAPHWQYGTCMSAAVNEMVALGNEILAA